MQTAKRVLLIEDDIDDQFFFELALQKINPAIQCVAANNGLEGLMAIEKPPPFDVIFTDLNMPLMDGFSFIKEVKNSNFKNIPVVVLTTSYRRDCIDKAKNLGASKYCVKPNKMEDLYLQLKPIVIRELV